MESPENLKFISNLTMKMNECYRKEKSRRALHDTCIKYAIQSQI